MRQQATCPSQRAGVRCELLPDGSGVLYDLATHSAYALTASAIQVWLACDGTTPPAAIADALAAQYDAPPSRILRHVEALLADLTACGVLLAPLREPT